MRSGVPGRAYSLTRVRSASSSGMRPEASTRCSTISASDMAFSVRSIPFCSTISFVSRIPAVSTMRNGIPSKAVQCSMRSRVVPAISVTIAPSSPASAFSKLDLPTLGAPTKATVMPSARTTPRRAFARRPSSFI